MGAQLDTWPRQAKPPRRIQPRSAARTSAVSPASGHGEQEEVIPVAEEELRVGKREVSGGRVRVRSYVVETPVQEQVSFREEHVSVERRPG